MGKIWIRRFAVIAMLGALTVSATACGTANDAVETEAETIAAETETVMETETASPYEAIGSAVGEEVYSLRVENASTFGVTGVTVKLDTEEEYPENLLEEGDVFGDGEIRVLYFDAADALEIFEASQETLADDAPLITPGFTVQVTYEDGVVHELHGFPFEDTAEVIL